MIRTNVIDLVESLDNKSFLIVCAVGTYVLGFLFRNQLYIRAMVFVGSLFYVWYYWVDGPEPLWDAIVGSALIALASAQGIVHILWSRMPSSVPHDKRHVFEQLSDIEPGQFRKLMRLGDHIVVDTPIALTNEGREPGALWFLVRGTLSLERVGQADVYISDPGFVGEISWLLDSGASATVRALHGTEVVRWEKQALKKTLRRNHRLELAVDSMIANDLARKLARSKPIEHLVAMRPEPSLVSNSR